MGEIKVLYPNEEGLVMGLKNKDDSAFEKLLETYGDKVLRLSYFIVKDLNVAEDITQEVFIQIYKKIKNFRGESSLYTWIYKITLNSSRNYMRRTQDCLTLIDDENIRSSDDVELEAIGSIDREKVKGAVFSMPEIYREAIVLFYYEDLPIKQICAILDEPEGTIKSRLSRARILLRDSLLKEGISNGC